VTTSSRPKDHRPEGKQFLALFFPEFQEQNLKADRDAYSRLATASCEAILADFIQLFDKHYATFGPGILIIQLSRQEQPPYYMPVDELRKDLETAERCGDTDVRDYLDDTISTIEGANINQCAVVMLSDNSSTRVFLLDRTYPAKTIQDALAAMGD